MIILFARRAFGDKYKMPITKYCSITLFKTACCKFDTDLVFQRKSAWRTMRMCEGGS